MELLQLDSIKEIETGWFTFLSTNGIQFGNLVLSPYQVCDGPSGGNCTVRFSTRT